MKGFSSRRLVLLASAAGLTIAAVAAGPSGFKSNLPAFTTPARADSVQPSAGFADVVAKVKPAVISVRVKIDETARTTGMGDNDESEANPGSPFEKFADREPRIGDWVVAVGNPFGLGGTVTAGIVSARGRDIGAGPYNDYIQIDAPINKGNSGGPTFNMDGSVIGVNTAIFSPSGGSVGIGFDIPAEAAKMVVAQLKERGYVDRAWLGVQVQPVTAEIANSLGLKKAEGALVAEPQTDSPAAKAGVAAGDVITAIDGAEIKDSRELARKIGMMAPGSRVKLTLTHKGEVKNMDLTLAKMPDQKQAKVQGEKDASTDSPRLGLNLAPAKDVGGAGSDGVAVVGVDPNGPASERGIKTGDVILDVGGKAVANVADVRKALTDARSAGKSSILLRVKTAEATRFVAMPIGKA